MNVKKKALGEVSHGAKRDVAAEWAWLSRMLKESPMDVELRKRHDMAKLAMSSVPHREQYLMTYHPPPGATPARIRAQRVDYTPRKPPPTDQIPTDEEFVLAWQSSSSIEETAEKLGIPGKEPWLACKAGAFSKIGVKLKKLGRRRKGIVDVKGLNRLIEGMEEEP